MQGVGRAAGLLMAWLGISLATLWLLGFGPPGLRLSDLSRGLSALSPPSPQQQATRPAPGAPPASTAPAVTPAVTPTVTPRFALSGPTSPAHVLDADSVPYLTPAAREAYRTWLTLNLPRVFTLAPDGTYSWAAGGGYTMDKLRTTALERCAAKGTAGCAVYAEDLSVVWPGQRSTPTPPPGPLISGKGYAFVPDTRFIWRGPDSARGVYVWAHGYGGPFMDGRGLQPQAHVRPFNNAGFDIVRFDRDPHTDSKENGERWMRDGLARLRQQGYADVIVGGQSRGAWNALQMLDTPGAADAIIAVSPAAHGEGPNSNVRHQLDDLRRIMDTMSPSRTRVIIAQFTGDGFSADPEWRAEVFRLNQMHVGGMLLIDRPAGLSGHFGGETFDFDKRFGACMLRFVENQPPLCPQ